MKKLFILSLIALVMTSCSTQHRLVYGLQLYGSGNGPFEVEFPQGHFAMDGIAYFDLNVGDSITLNSPEAVATQEYVLGRNRKSELKAIKRVNSFITNGFNALSAGDGAYDFWLKGFVKETWSGLTFEVERHFSNVMPLKKYATNRCQFVK